MLDLGVEIMAGLFFFFFGRCRSISDSFFATKDPQFSSVTQYLLISEYINCSFPWNDRKVLPMKIGCFCTYKEQTSGQQKGEGRRVGKVRGKRLIYTNLQCIK